MKRIALAIGVLLFLWFFVMGDQGVADLRKLYLMRHHLRLEQEELTADLFRLEAEHQLLSDPNKMEMIIRKELRAIKPGEVIFELPKADPQVAK